MKKIIPFLSLLMFFSGTAKAQSRACYCDSIINNTDLSSILVSDIVHGSGGSLSCSSLSNASASCSTDATVATNITSGTLPAARLPSPTSSTLGGVKSLAQSSHFFLDSIGTDGVPTKSQPVCGDLSNAATSCSTDATNASNISSGTLPAARLPAPSSSTLGGVRSYAQVTSQWINSISPTGVPSSSQPACGDLSNSAASCSTDTTVASNISSGTLPAARLPAPSSSTLGGVRSYAQVSSQWINSISPTGIPSSSQPACGDLSNAATSCSTDTTNASNISSGTLPAARLPAPASSTLGGVKSYAQVTSQWINSITPTGTPVSSQPACGDLSNAAASCSTDATNASNISSGTLNASRLPTATVTPGAYTLTSITVDAHGLVTAASSGSAGAVQTDAAEARNLGISVTVSSSTLVVALKQGDGSTDPSSGSSAVNVAFRSSTTTSGAYTEGSFTAATSITLAAADSIGFNSSTTDGLYAYLVSDTTSEMCLSETLFDDGAVQTASALTGSADTDGTKLWCPSAHTSKPIRRIAKFNATWSNPNWSAPANVQLSLSNLSGVPVSRRSSPAQPREENYYVSNPSGTATFADVSDTNAAVVRNSAGNITITYGKPWGVKPTCACTPEFSGENTKCTYDTQIVTPSTTSIGISTNNSAGASTDMNFQLICKGKW